MAFCWRRGGRLGKREEMYAPMETLLFLGKPMGSWRNRVYSLKILSLKHWCRSSSLSFIFRIIAIAPYYFIAWVGGKVKKKMAVKVPYFLKKVIRKTQHNVIFLSENFPKFQGKEGNCRRALRTTNFEFLHQNPHC